MIAAYTDGWRRFWSIESVKHILADIGLLAFAIVSIALMSIVSGSLATPLIESLQAVNPQSTNPAVDLAVELGARDVTFNSVLTSVITGTALIYIAALFLFGLGKGLIWQHLAQRKRDWRRASIAGGITAGAGLVAAALPLLILFKNPWAAAFIGLIILFALLLILPLSYALLAAKVKRKNFSLAYAGFVGGTFVTWVGVAYALSITGLVSETLHFLLVLAWLLIFMAWNRNYLLATMGVRA